ILTTMQKDLISEIIMNQKYDWSFVFKTPVIERPLGDVMLMVSQDFLQYTSSRIFIIRSKERLHLIGQIQIDKHEDERLVDFENLVKYQQTCKKNGILRSIDLDNPYYNI